MSVLDRLSPMALIVALIAPVAALPQELQPAARPGLPEPAAPAGAEAGAARPRPVVSELVEDRGPDTRWIPGHVAARTEVAMAFQTMGRMIARHVDIGDRVQQGDLLAELDTEDLSASTRAARAALDAAEVQLDTARTTLRRTQELAARNVASTAQLEDAQRMVAAAEAAHQQALSEWVRATDAQGFARMEAPFAGIVSAVMATPGMVVDSGSPVLQLSADDQREVVIDLAEADLAGLRPGQLFTVWQRDAPDDGITATLDRIGPQTDSATRTRRLYLTLPKDAPFRLGAQIRARLGTAYDPALSLPEQAILATPDGPQVWRVERSGQTARVALVPVVTGPSHQGRVTIQNGIAEGDEIVVRGVNSLQPGQPVGRRIAP